MIYEVRTYDVKPGTHVEVLKRMAEAYEHRKKFSQMAAIWHTEIGPLNQIVHIWPYKDIEERNRIRDLANRESGGKWPPDTTDFVTRQRSDIFLPFPFTPEMKPGSQGPFFEMRIYTTAPRQIPNLAKAWELALPARLKMGPLTTVLRSELGGLNQFLQVWPYRSLDERTRIRREAQQAGIWPPSAVAKKAGLPDVQLVQQENKILIPAPNSPLQ
jgi:hypothetical protein